MPLFVVKGCMRKIWWLVKALYHRCNGEDCPHPHITQIVILLFSKFLSTSCTVPPFGVMRRTLNNNLNVNFVCVSVVCVPVICVSVCQSRTINHFGCYSRVEDVNHGQSNSSMATTRMETTHGLTNSVARAIDITAWQSIDAVCLCCLTHGACVKVTGLKLSTTVTV